MNPDLASERQNPPFNLRALTSFLYGGDKVLERRNFIANLVETTPEFKDPKDRSFMTREERYENSMRKTVAMLKHADKLDTSEIAEIHYYQSLVLAGDSSPIHLHYVMFLPSLQGQGSDEQLEKWLPLALSHKVVGTYAQTELGHGTNLKNLETTATYDAQRQEFVINSPTLSSTKWWPGNLGKSSNHAIVVAQLYTKGVCHGVHGFIVQIRDMDTHMPLPGVLVGDIGPKFGIQANDNGFLRLDHVRVPRENMLMRFSKVDPDGTYHRPSHDKLVYGAMIYVRSVMIVDQALALGMAATIATRYSCVRRQGEKVAGQGEVKLLDYQTQQYRLFPELAKTYAFFFAGETLRTMYKQISLQLKQGDVELLPELHFVSAGLKGYVSYEVAKGLEICRLSCGGHGYSQASGFPTLYGDTVGACTYEGENIVMFLQVARYLVKAVKQKTNNRISSYLWRDSTKSRSDLNQDLKLDHLLDVYEHAARRMIFEAVNQLDVLGKQGYSNEDAWDKCAVTLTKCAKAHVRVFLVKNFIEYVETAKDPNVKRVMRLFCQLYALYGVHVKSGSFIEDGYVSAQQILYVRHRLYETLAEIRPMAVLLVDAFDFKDRELNSVLGRYDGDVYPNLFKWARESPLNKKEVMDCHYKYVTPLQSKL